MAWNDRRNADAGLVILEAEVAAAILLLAVHAVVIVFDVPMRRSAAAAGAAAAACIIDADEAALAALLRPMLLSMIMSEAGIYIGAAGGFSSLVAGSCGKSGKVAKWKNESGRY